MRNEKQFEFGAENETRVPVFTNDIRRGWQLYLRSISKRRIFNCLYVELKFQTLQAQRSPEILRRRRS